MSHNEQWWKQSIQYSSRSDIGMRRTNNQDSRYCQPAATMRLWHSRGHLFVVADGMGAHAAGELASQMATDAIPQCYLKKTEELPWEALRNAVLETHQLIKRHGQTDEAFRDMGTTVDVLLLLPEGAIVAHVGDSRVYRLRDGVYEQLTFDHSLLWEIKRSGRIPADKIPAYIPKNIITRSLGPTEKLEVDIEGPLPLEQGDTFLLCSDGLSGPIEDAEMAQILQLLPPDEATETLVNLANLRGGPDNITVTVIRVLDIPPRDELKRDRAYEMHRHAPTSGLFLLALSIACFVPIFSFLVPKFEHWFVVSLISFILTLLFFGAFLFVSRRSLFPGGGDRLKTEPMGRGPYSQASAIPSFAFAERLTETKRQLVDAFVKQKLLTDWEYIKKCEHELEKASAQKIYGEVIKYNAKIINTLMAAVKNISSEKSRGS